VLPEVLYLAFIVLDLVVLEVCLPNVLLVVVCVFSTTVVTTRIVVVVEVMLVDS
jgi:hypothetical protein